MAELTPPSRAFVLGLADGNGLLDGGALYELGAAVGLTDTTIRLTVRRLVEAGLVESTGRGRASSISLTTEGLEARSQDLGWTAFAYRLDAGLVTWDGRWHLVSFEIPETKRAGRDALRAQLVELMGASLSGGLYVSPHAWEAWTHRVATTNGIAQFVTTLETERLRVGGERDPRAIAARLWPLQSLDDQAMAFVKRWAPTATRAPANLSDAARAAFTASIEFETIIRQDPLLPTGLEPDDWNGAAARDVYGRVLRSLSERHATIKRANVFSAFLNAIEETAAMSDEAFGAWLFETTRPS